MPAVVCMKYGGIVDRSAKHSSNNVAIIACDTLWAQKADVGRRVDKDTFISTYLLVSDKKDANIQYKDQSKVRELLLKVHNRKTK